MMKLNRSWNQTNGPFGWHQGDVNIYETYLVITYRELIVM